MSDSSIVQGLIPGDKRCYTYALLLPDGRAFYYGKGTRRRVFQHKREAQSGKFINRHKNHTIRKLWANSEDYRILILAYHATEQDAFMHEIALIFLSGDKLTNLTLGGEGSFGSIHSEETRRKLSEAQKGKKHSEETRRKMSKVQTGHPGYTIGRLVSEETRRKLSETGKGRKRSEETRRKISEGHKGLIRSEEHTRKVREANKGRKRSEETRRKISEGGKGKKISEKQRLQISAVHKGKLVSEETRKKLSLSTRAAYARKREQAL